MILFIIGLFIYIILTNDKTMKKLLFIICCVYLINKLYYCYKTNILNEHFENENNITPLNNVNIDYKKQIYELLNGKLDVLKNVDIFEINKIGETLRYKSQYCIKIKPINFMFIFIHVKKYDITNQTENKDYEKNNGLYKINYPEIFKEVNGAQISQIYDEKINEQNISLIKELNNNYILIDSNVDKINKYPCYVMIYGIY
jgi:hypothetical protein